jgi:predicted RNase H-like HicB family nuclease
MYKYQLVMYWDNKDQLFIIEVPELPGCMAHGETQEIALSNIQTAIELWIETAQEFGDPIPQPNYQSVLLSSL